MRGRARCAALRAARRRGGGRGVSRSFGGPSRRAHARARAFVSFRARSYKAELTPEQREQLRVLLKAQVHDFITPEIRRELFQQTKVVEDDGDDSSMRLG